MSRFRPSPQATTIPSTFTHHEDHSILHPDSGLVSWGRVVVTSSRLKQDGGEIFLRAGKHKGPHSGFGVRHIWMEHGHELIKWGYTTIDDVPRFVAEIVVHGTNVVCEFNDMRGLHRVIAIRGRKGCAVLSAWEKSGEIHYSVVTAYRNRTPNGSPVGRIESTAPQ